MYFHALDKMLSSLLVFYYFSIQTYAVCTHWKHLIEIIEKLPMSTTAYVFKVK